MVNQDRSRKLLVRTAFVTGTTIAVLFGAQNLAMLDARQQETVTPHTSRLNPTLIPVSTIREQQSPEIAVTVVQAAPSITILSQSGNPNTASANSAGQAAIQPPVASLLATSEPLIVQSQTEPQVIFQQSNQPVQQSTGSSQ